MKRTLDVEFDLGGATYRPAKIDRPNEGPPALKGPPRLALKLSHRGRADLVADFCASIGAEDLACKVTPVVPVAVEKKGRGKGSDVFYWAGNVRLGTCKVSRANGDEKPTAAIQLLLETHDADTILQLFALRLAMMHGEEPNDRARVELRPVQDGLDFDGDGGKAA